MNRPRAQAMQRAYGLLERLRSDPARFAELAAAESDAYDAAVGGDMGSVARDGARPLEVAVLSRLPVGGVSDPIEQGNTIAIFQRIAGSEQDAIKFEEIFFSYADAGVDATDAAARKRLRNRARRVLAAVGDDASEFARWQREICCADAVRWGGGSLGEIRARIAAVPHDVIVPELIETAIGFHIVRRVAYTPPDPPEQLLDLPRGDVIDRKALVRWTTGANLADFARATAPTVAAELALAPDEADAFFAVVERHLPSLAVEDANARGEAAVAMRAAVAQLLGPKRSVAYDFFVERHVRERMMALGATSASLR
jgi:hypothetical protein